MRTEMLFSRFERFWHWTQAALIVGLLTTGFEIHQSYALLGYQEAAELHRLFAWSLIGLWVFAIFWHAVTGEWRQYVPTTQRLVAVVRYYTAGIFRADVPHPHKKTKLSKHNPLQRLAYLSLKVAINPVIVVSGLLYMYVNDWPALGLGFLSLEVVALVHVAAAFAMLVFLIAHVYMAFTGKPVHAYMQAMITGHEPAEE